MKPVNIEVSQVIQARAADVYNVIADYEVGHQAILPRPPFDEMIIKKGSFGAGTEIVLHMSGMGLKYTYHQRVSEPEPGRIILETEINTGQWTQFTVDPIDANTSRVTIKSYMPMKNTVRGFIESLTFPLSVPPVFKKELNLLNDYMQSQQRESVALKSV